MKIKVLHDDGSTETLTLTGDLVCLESRHFRRFQADDLEHFFTPDGHYDGSGRALHATPLEDALRRGETIEVM
ncbi:MAG: hypothetical protein QF681_06465 [Vicinamibacterales bacterium]|jgi:hypothetical protein|nr:hypothetical protein [Vicinamibacterales bacterium]